MQPQTDSSQCHTYYCSEHNMYGIAYNSQPVHSMRNKLKTDILIGVASSLCWLNLALAAGDVEYRVAVIDWRDFQSRLGLVSVSRLNRPRLSVLSRSRSNSDY